MVIPPFVTLRLPYGLTLDHLSVRLPYAIRATVLT